MKARRNRFWSSGRLHFLGQVHWKSSRDLSTGKRAFLMRRAMLRFSRRPGFALNQLLQIIQVRALLLGGPGGQGLVVALM